MQTSVLEYFEQGALARCPHRVAVVDDGRRLTFAQLERAAKYCAALMIRRVSAVNQPIAVFLPKGTATICADLGILYTGNCYANLDVKSPPERLRAILGNLGAALVVTSSSLAPALRRVDVDETRILTIDDVMAGDAAFDDALFRARRARVLDTDPVCIIHTSGSTGVPKGVALSHRGTIDFVDWAFEHLALDGSEVIGSLSPFYFDIYTLELYLCLAKGATLVVIPEHLAAFPASVLDFVAAQAVSFVFWVPTIMVNIANQDLLTKWRLESLKKVLFAGEVFPTRQLNYWRRHLPWARFVNLYGPIEIHVDCSYFVLDRDMADDEKLPIGFPCRNTDILILDDKNQAPADGHLGELCVRGTSVGLGYWNNPERTAQAFVQNPLNPHYPELIYRTGDLVYRNERGELMFAGRKDFQIKHLGYRIELGEIEHAVMRVEGIRHACVVYQPARKEITLFFESDRDLTAAAIRESLAGFLPKYMLPTVFHRMEQLPRNPNGKIDRQHLAGLVA